MGGEGRTSEFEYVVASGWFEGGVEDSEGSPEGGAFCAISEASSRMCWCGVLRVSPGYLWKNGRGVLSWSRVKPGGVCGNSWQKWLVAGVCGEIARKESGVGDCLPRPGLKGSPRRREAQSRVGCGGIAG